MSGCAAIIPARGGSKGVKLKNLRKIGGVRLIARSVLAARGCASISQIIVSTDCPEIARASEQAGARVIFRPEEISGDAATSESAILHALETLRSEGNPPDHTVFLQCTSPFTTAEEITAVLAPVLAGEADSAFSAVPSHGFLWRENPDGTVSGTNHDDRKQRMRRQDLPPEFRETGAIYAFRTEGFLASTNRFTGRVRAVLAESPAFDIDEPADIIAAHATARKLRQTASRPGKIKVLVTDFDGVHTNAKVAVTQDGVETVTCSRRDGFAIGAARTNGLRVMILSKERNPVVLRRAEKLGIECISGCDDKLTALRQWLPEHNLHWDEIAYVGDDLNDIDGLQLAGLSFCPADADPFVRSYCDVVLAAGGGNGCVREAIQHLGYFPTSL